MCSAGVSLYLQASILLRQLFTASYVLTVSERATADSLFYWAHFTDCWWSGRAACFFWFAQHRPRTYCKTTAHAQLQAGPVTNGKQPFFLYIGLWLSVKVALVRRERHWDKPFWPNIQISITVLCLFKTSRRKLKPVVIVTVKWLQSVAKHFHTRTTRSTLLSSPFEETTGSSAEMPQSKYALVVVYVSGVRLCLWTAATKGPVVNLADDIRL
jgi:hypothetical protein